MEIKKLCLSVVVASVALLFGIVALAEETPGRSQPIASVLREPLPPEELACTQTDTQIVVQGPTFSYSVDKRGGAIVSLSVLRDGKPVIESLGAADIVVDGLSLASPTTVGKTDILSQGKDKVVLRSEGALQNADAAIRYTLKTTVFNDGVAVCEMSLLPEKDLEVRDRIEWRLPARGRFATYLHKRRDEDGVKCASEKLPSAETVRFSTLTSCLQVFSPESALALFTDSGAVHMSAPELDTAAIEVKENAKGQSSLTLSQYIAHVKPGAEPFLLKAGNAFTFRVGISVAPNRLPHRRAQDLRMYTWIGDAKYPYPTDDEIMDAARLGYTVYQLHRVGTPGEPRPPEAEFPRVLKTVHDAGMLFVWEENADLMFACAPGIVDMKAKNKWPLWQGFNYGGRYTAPMDPYCDLDATCLASPNGLAEYRLDNLNRMMDRYPVDGIYLDDNMAYSNCTLWKEHGHPQQVYDCLIELHEMNWRRRELLRARCPHAVLISHNTTGLVLPVICDFDASLYGEGYGFGSLESYWEFFGMVKGIPAQGQIWPGSSDKSRCAASLAYNYDLLTGGGQFEYCDWRQYPQKFAYGEGIIENELTYIKTYTLAQYYFGLYESTPYFFADSTELFSTNTPLTYASLYRNRVWNDYLIPVANMAGEAQTTSLTLHKPEDLGLTDDAQYALYDVIARTIRTSQGKDLHGNLAGIGIPKGSLRLFYLRTLPLNTACHLWGGKRISETTQPSKLVVELSAPAGLQDVVVLNGAGKTISEVRIDGKASEFFVDPAKGLVHGTVTFAAQPVKLEATLSEDGRANLPEKALPPGPLALKP